MSMKSRSMAESFSYAIMGLVQTVTGERNMKIHILAAITVIIAASFLPLTRLEWGLLVITIFMVLIAETINTAIEKTVDLVTGEYHPLARKAKNMAAGAVLLSAAAAVVMAYIIFSPYLFKG